MKNLVLIIGGTSGLGLETANYLLNKDYEVIVCGRRDIKSEKLNSMKVNVKSDRSVKDLYHEVQNNYGNINGLVFSAGITTPKKLIEYFSSKTLLKSFALILVFFIYKK